MSLSIEQAITAYYNAVKQESCYETSDYLCDEDALYTNHIESDEMKELLTILNDNSVPDNEIGRIERLIQFMIGNAVNEAVSDLDDRVEYYMEHQENINFCYGEE